MQTEKQLTFNIEFDGNDGTGKTYIINLIKQFFNNCIFKDRGIFSKATLLNKDSEEKMYDYIDNNIDSDTLYIILDDFDMSNTFDYHFVYVRHSFKESDYKKADHALFIQQKEFSN